MAENPYKNAAVFPKDFQMVDGLGILMPAWQYFLRALWDKAGSGITNITYTIIDPPAPAPAAAFAVAPRTAVPTPILYGPGPNNGLPISSGAPPVSAPAVQTLTSSPWSFNAPVNGFMALSGGEVDYSRDGVSYYKASMLGGQILMVQGDHINVIWYGPAPSATWFPGGF